MPKNTLMDTHKTWKPLFSQLETLFFGNYFFSISVRKSLIVPKKVYYFFLKPKSATKRWGTPSPNETSVKKDVQSRKKVKKGIFHNNEENSSFPKDQK